MLWFKFIKYLPFVSAIIYTILYAILLIGASFGHTWFDTSNDITAIYYRKYAFFAIENYNIFLDFPLIILLLLFLLKIFKKEIFLFYISLILILIDIYLGGFCMSYWNPHY
jgi:hypothetical protein